MKLHAAVQACDPQAAAHSARQILLVCAAAVSVLTLLGQQGSSPLAVTGWDRAGADRRGRVQGRERPVRPPAARAPRGDPPGRGPHRDAVVSRPGGDELAVLLLDCPAGVATRRAEDLLTAVLAAPLTLTDGTLLALSISVGVAHVSGHAEDLEELYHAAEAALYDAKRAGRGRVVTAQGVPGAVSAV